MLPPVALQVLSARMTRPPANHDMDESERGLALRNCHEKGHVFVISLQKISGVLSTLPGCVSKGGLDACRCLSSRGVD